MPSLQKKLTIRQEILDDYATVYALTKAAFDAADHADGDEAQLPERLRARDSYIPELSLVAELDGLVAGHILFTEITIGEQPALCLGIVSVLPELQGKGIGSALIQKGHQVARELGFSVCVLAGHEGYYPRFGYQPINRHGIIFPFEGPEECLMVKFLNDRGKSVRGAAIFPPELIPGS